MKHAVDHEPEHIRLPDGRTFTVSELFKQISRPIRFNIKTGLRTHRQGTVVGIPNYEHGNAKYSPEERVWQSQASLEDIMNRYQISEKSAQLMRYRARDIVNYLKKHSLLDNKD